MNEIDTVVRDGGESDEQELVISREPLESIFRLLVEHGNDIPYIADTDGRLLFLGSQFERYGFSAEEVMQQGVMEIIVPEDRERVAEELERSMATGEEFPTSFRIRTREGEVRWLEDHGTIRRDAEGNIMGLIGVLRDITARKRVEFALLASEERFRLLAEQSMDAMFIIDLTTTTMVYVSPSIEVLTGYRPEELLSKAPLNLPSKPDPQRIAEGLARLERDGRVEGFEMPFLRKDGTEAIVEVNATIVGRGTESVQIQGVVRDITQRRALEEQLRHQQKMEALGTLAGGIAHDFNNLLTGILGGASLLKRCADNTERVVQTAEVIERAAIRASELTQHLLGFARPSMTNHGAVHIHRLIEDVVALLGRTLGRQIAITTKLRAHPPVVQGDAAQLQQVVLNLVINASDAMPKGGRIVVETETVEIGKEDVKAHPALVPGAHIVLRVIDTGVGMTDEVLQRIFEPFFTTKESLGRSGLGLSTVYGILKSHSGDLHVESSPGEGSTFEVYLRCATDAEDGSIECTETPVEGRGRLMVVDDEQVVREAASVILPELGYDVTCARDGREAVEIYNSQWRELDLVILDLTMPLMSGAECFQALKEINPEVKVLLSTGHSFDAEAQSLLEKGVIGFVQKPYTMRQLADKVSEALKSLELSS